MIGLTLRQLADAKGLTVEDLASFGVAEGKHDGAPCVEIPYRDVEGRIVATKKRLRLDEPGRFLWPKGKKTIPYGLDRLASLPPGAPILLVEGESDRWTCLLNGIAALGIPGAASWKSSYAALLTGRPVLVWQEPGAGANLVAAVTRDLPDARVIRGEQTGPKDPNDLWLTLGCERAAFAASMQARMETARSPREEAAAARVAEAAAALAASGGLLDDPEILRHVERDIVQSGYAGDTTAPRIVHLALTSRCLRRPMNLGIVAASASGKNTAIDVVLPLFPSSAYVLVKASSARALVYGSDDFEHRTLIVGEVDCIPEEGPAASAVRSIAADNSMAYEVVERDETTGRWGTRKIVKAGPTGLITTSTKPLGDQMGTRMLEIGIPDSAEQTRAIMRAHAAAVNGTQSVPDPARQVAAQRWLELVGVRDVAIPFAAALVDLVPADLLRMRRDFRQLLTAIEAVAFLRQRQRARDAHGLVVATLDDYRHVRELLLDVFTATATGGVTRRVREVVRIVRELAPSMPSGVRVAEIVSKMTPAVHVRTVQHHVKRAVGLGYLARADVRQGQPMKLLPGNDLPDDREALPTVEELASAYHPEMAVAVSRVPEEPITAGSGTATPPPVAPPSQDADAGTERRGGGARPAPVAVDGLSLLAESEGATARYQFPSGDGLPGGVGPYGRTRHDLPARRAEQWLRRGGRRRTSA